MNKNIYSIVFLCLLLIGMNYINAWTGPATSPAPTNPPNNNVAAPLNIGSTAQVKNGGLGVTNLAADSILSTGVVQSNTQMRSPQYCDVTGTNCILFEDINHLSGSTAPNVNTAVISTGQTVSVSCAAVNGAAVSVLTGGGCSMIGSYDELATDEGDILSYPATSAGETTWVCENKNLAPTTVTAHAVCLELYNFPPSFGGA